MTDLPFSNREIELMLAGIDQKLTGILDHVKETNGRVHKLEVTTARLEKDMDERDSNLEKLINKTDTDIRAHIKDHENYVKVWVLKTILATTLLGSFIWIKESRDAIISILKMFV